VARVQIQAAELLVSRAGAIKEGSDLLHRIRLAAGNEVTSCPTSNDPLCWVFARAASRLAIARGDTTRARQILDDEERRLQLSKPWPTAPANLTAEQLAELRGVRGELADAQGQALDAIVHFRRALAMGDADLLHQARAWELWRALGGTETTWNDAPWADGAALHRLTWQRLDTPFRLNAVRDLDGRAWSTSDLNDETVLVSFWATWCAPCISELNFVQQLHERLAKEPNFKVVAINLDDPSDSVKPFVNLRRWTFPVLLGHAAFPAELESGLPLNWIVTGTGRVVRLEGGFATDGSVDWAAAMLAEMRGVAAQPPQ
jgi:thiol-disulfide isomerase/thioredoxin